jgi:DHA2 family metal-tetracycline-proton antiporter-like MFS transporter
MEVKKMTLYQAERIKNETFLYLALRYNVLLTVMNTTMFTIALPVISHQLQLSPLLASWIVTSYSVMFAISTVLYSRLTDVYPIKYLLFIGLFLLGTGSLLGVFAQHVYTLVIARLIQALGASCIPGVSMIITNRYIPLERRGAVMGKVSSTTALAFGMGPIVGGIVSQYLGWKFLFVVTLSALLMLPVYYKQLPAENITKDKIDFTGIFLLSTGVICSLLFISIGNFLFLIGCFCLGLFWLHIHRKELPFISPSLMKTWPYLCSLGLGFFAFFINFAVLFILPLLLASRFHASSLEIGGTIFPGAVCSALASIYIGRFLDRRGAADVLKSGFALMIGALFLFSGFGYVSMWLILCFYAISGIGFTCIQVGIPYCLARLFSQREFSTAIGLQQLLQFFGGAFGVTCAGNILERNTISALNPFWMGGDGAYSNTFVALQFAGLIGGIFLCFFLKTVRESDSKMYY